MTRKNMTQKKDNRKPRWNKNKVKFGQSSQNITFGKTRETICYPYNSKIFAMQACHRMKYRVFELHLKRRLQNKLEPQLHKNLWTLSSSLNCIKLGSPRNRTAGTPRTTERRKNVARDCAFPILRNIFSSFCRHWFSRSSCCVSSLMITIKTSRL